MNSSLGHHLAPIDPNRPVQAARPSKFLLQELHLLSHAMQFFRPLRVLQPPERDDDLGDLTNKHGDLI